MTAPVAFLCLCNAEQNATLQSPPYLVQAAVCARIGVYSTAGLSAAGFGRAASVLRVDYDVAAPLSRHRKGSFRHDSEGPEVSFLSSSAFTVSLGRAYRLMYAT